MKRIILLLAFIISTLIACAQVSGGMLKRQIPQASAKSSGSTVKKKSSSQARKSAKKPAKKSNTNKSYQKKQSQEKDDEEDDGFDPEADAELFYQWGVEDLNAEKYSEAKEWFELAVSANEHSGAANFLGFMYYEGTGVETDYEKAFIYFKIAAKDEKYLAKWYVGYMMDTGKGVKQDKTEARYWYRKSLPKIFDYAKEDLDNNDSSALSMLNALVIPDDTPYRGRALALLGDIYYEGKCGVDIDHIKAAEYFEAAVYYDCTASNYFLGICYKNGIGVKKDKSKAKKQLKASGCSSWYDALYKIKNPEIPSSW